jgi:hypothetical protein
MNKLTSQRQTVERPVSFAAGPFVRVRTMLRARHYTVKRPRKPKTLLPIKNSIGEKPGKKPPQQRGRLARLYANGIFAAV